jgi:hypothetical protein
MPAAVILDETAGRDLFGRVDVGGRGDKSSHDIFLPPLSPWSQEMKVKR